MKRILIPITDSPASLATVRAAAVRGVGTIDIIDLVSVQPRLPQHVAQWIPKRIRDDWRRERAERALAPARQLVESMGIGCRVHVAVGHEPQAIAELARLTGAAEVIGPPLTGMRRLALPAGIGLGLGAALLMLAEE